jgi:hypothetical protein
MRAMINDMNSPLDPFVYNNSYYPTDLAASQYYYQSGGSSDNNEQIQQIIMMYSELKGVAPEEIVEGLKDLSEEEVSQQLQLMIEEIEDADYQQQIEEARKSSEEQDVDASASEEEGMSYGYDPEEFIERQNMILQNQQQEANNQIAEEEEAEPEPTEAQSYLSDPYKYGGAKKRFISKLKKAMGGMDVVNMPQADFNKNNYGENMLGSFVQGVQNNSKKALINEAAQNVEKTFSQNPEMLLAPMAQFGMQMYNPMSTLSANAGAGMDYINSRMPSNQSMMNSFGNAFNAFVNDTGIGKAGNDQQQTLRYGGDLPKAQKGKEYARKLWEQQFGTIVPAAQQQALFDEFYSRMKPQVWNDIASQTSNVQSAGNMFNNIPGLGQNPGGYRAFNNPYLQQYAYNPRWYAQKPGSNKKINVRNLPDWSDANLIQTEQMTNPRGRTTGYRYTLQKPSSVIRTEQPAADPNYVVPKVPDVMLNPAAQPVIGPVAQKTPSDNTIDLSAVGPINLSNDEEIKELNSQDLIEAQQKNSRRAGFKSNPQNIDPYDLRSSVYYKSGSIKPFILPTKNNSADKLEISNEKRKQFDETIKNATQGTTIELAPKQYGGPSLVPYSNEYMTQQYADYKNFYDDYTRPPSTGTKGDGYDAYDSYMRRNIKKNPVYASGWLEESKDGKLKIFYDEADDNTEPEPSSKYNVRRVDNEIVGYENDPVESNMISDMSHAMAWQNAADKRKNKFPQKTYPGFLKSQQKGGQLYLYRDGGLPKFQGTELSELQPRSYPDPFKAGVTESNMEYPEETLDVVQTTKPNFLSDYNNNIYFYNLNKIKCYQKKLNMP